MTSANVFNLNSVKQGQVLNANAAKGRSKAENPDAAGVFASLMGSNYSTNFNMPSVDTKINNNVLQQTNAADNYDRYQYQDNTIRQAAGDVVTDVIGNSTDTLDQFQGDVVRTVAEQLGVSEDSVKDMMESLRLTAFDLLNLENLAQLAMQLTGETSPMDLLMNDQFQGLMQQMNQLGGQLANELNLQPAQMEELIVQMDILQTPETLTDEEMQVLTDVAGQRTTADTVSADMMPELAQTDEVRDYRLGFSRAGSSGNEHMRSVSLFVEVETHDAVLVLAHRHAEVACYVVFAPVFEDSLLDAACLYHFGSVAVHLEQRDH